MNPSASTPTSTSVPDGPLGRYLLHPGQETSTVVHHVLHVLVAVGRVAVPVLFAVVALVVVGRLVLAVTRRQRSTGAHLVSVAPGPEVEPSGAEALWNGLHGVLRRGGLAGMVSGRPHVGFEVGFETGRLRFALWVPAQVSASRVAGVVEAAWPGSVTEVLAATSPLPGGEGIVAGEMRLAQPEWFGLRVDHPADPYRLLLAALSGLGPDDAGVVQVLARPATRRRYRRCRTAAVALRTGRPRSKLVRFVDFWMTRGVPHTPNLSADPTRAADIRAITEKASSLCFEATIRYGIVGQGRGHGERQRLKAEGHAIVGALAMFDGRNRLTRRRLARPWRTLCARHLGRRTRPGRLYHPGHPCRRHPHRHPHPEPQPPGLDAHLERHVGPPRDHPDQPAAAEHPVQPVPQGLGPGRFHVRPGGDGHQVGAGRALPAGHGEHQATDHCHCHHGDEGGESHPAGGDQHIQDVVDERRGLLAGMEQVAAERAAGHRRWGRRWGRLRRRVHGPPLGRGTTGSL